MKLKTILVIILAVFSITAVISCSETNEESSKSWDNAVWSGYPDASFKSFLETSMEWSKDLYLSSYGCDSVNYSITSFEGWGSSSLLDASSVSDGKPVTYVATFNSTSKDQDINRNLELSHTIFVVYNSSANSIEPKGSIQYSKSLITGEEMSRELNYEDTMEELQGIVTEVKRFLD